MVRRASYVHRTLANPRTEGILVRLEPMLPFVAVDFCNLTKLTFKKGKKVTAPVTD